MVGHTTVILTLTELFLPPPTFDQCELLIDQTQLEVRGQSSLDRDLKGSQGLINQGSI